MLIPVHYAVSVKHQLKLQTDYALFFVFKQTTSETRKRKAKKKNLTEYTVRQAGLSTSLES